VKGKGGRGRGKGMWSELLCILCSKRRSTKKGGGEIEDTIGKRRGVGGERRVENTTAQGREGKSPGCQQPANVPGVGFFRRDKKKDGHKENTQTSGRVVLDTGEGSQKKRPEWGGWGTCRPSAVIRACVTKRGETKVKKRNCNFSGRKIDKTDKKGGGEGNGMEKRRTVGKKESLASQKEVGEKKGGKYA